MFGILNELKKRLFPKYCFIVKHVGNNGKIIGVFYNHLQATGRLITVSNLSGLTVKGDDLVGVVDGQDGAYCFSYGDDGRARLMLQKKRIF